MKSLGVLWLIVFISLMGFGVTAVPFPLVAEQMGASDFWKTFGGAGVFSLFQLVATPLWGRWSDALGRKPILIYSSAGSLLAYLWLAYADTLTSLIVARAFGGIMSGNLSAAFAYATDVTDPKDRARGLGIVASAFGVGFAVGPPLGGFLGSGPGGVPSLHGPALASALFSLLALLGTAFLLRESLPREQRKPWRAAAAATRAPVASAAAAAGTPGSVPAAAAPGARRSPFAALAARPVLAGLIVATLVVATGGGAMQSVFQFWGRDLFGFTLRDVGVQFMVFALLSAVGQAGLIGPLARRFGEKPVAIASIAGVAIGLLLFALAANVAMVWLGIVIFGLANGLFLPSVTSLVSFEADPRNRGAVMGLFNAASSAGRIVGPAVSGPVYFSVGASAPFVGAAVLAGFGALLLSRARARPVPDPAAAASPPPGDPIG
ncbi:MAG: MFS transporter [Steroidobacteraceae bacterium]|jgi:MFS family permease|nr:MFS transporter [Steroidobacteraceae bacterium]